MTSLGLTALLGCGHVGEADIAKIARVAFLGESRLVGLLGGTGSKLDSSLAAKARRFVEDAISVLRAAMTINPDEEAVIRWFNEQRLPFLSNATPAEALALGYREPLLRYIASLESRWTG
jgi:hypothetical protein